MTDQEANAALEKMARDINKNLPPDLWNYMVQISMSKEGVFATAIPLEDTYLDTEDCS